MPYADVAKQRAYDRLWKRNKRAEAKADELTPERVVERIAALEKEIRDLKNTVPALVIDQPAARPVQNEREERIKRFSARLSVFSMNRPGSIPTCQAELDDLEKEFKAIVKEGPEFPDRIDLHQRLCRERDIIRELEGRADWLQQAIADQSKGGIKRTHLENLIKEDHIKGKRQLNDPDPQVRRAGDALLKGGIERIGELADNVTKMKAELAQLRGRG